MANAFRKLWICKVWSVKKQFCYKCICYRVDKYIAMEVGVNSVWMLVSYSKDMTYKHWVLGAEGVAWKEGDLKLYNGDIILIFTLFSI